MAPKSTQAEPRATRSSTSRANGRANTAATSAPATSASRGSVNTRSERAPNVSQARAQCSAAVESASGDQLDHQPHSETTSSHIQSRSQPARATIDVSEARLSGSSPALSTALSPSETPSQAGDEQLSSSDDFSNPSQLHAQPPLTQGGQAEHTGGAARSRKPRLQSLEEQRLRDEAKAERDAARAVRAAERKAEKKAEDEEKKVAAMQEVNSLIAAARPAPPHYNLQLTSPPPRPNITGRTIPLSLLPQDSSFPLSHVARETFVEQLLTSMRDIRDAEDTISPTTEFKSMWLKPGLKGQISYGDVSNLERVCRELVAVAEALHTHGLGATRIYCARTIQKAESAKAMSFKERIDKLALLIRKSKARCHDFLLGNTMDDTIALIDQKLKDQRTNAANNKNRSDKLSYTNKLFGKAKGSKWTVTDGNGPFPMVPDASLPPSAGTTPSGESSTPQYQEVAGYDRGLEQAYSFEDSFPPTTQAQYGYVEQDPPAWHSYPMHPEPSRLPWNAENEAPAMTQQAFDDIDFDAYEANANFDAMYASHHGFPLPDVHSYAQSVPDDGGRLADDDSRIPVDPSPAGPIAPQDAPAAASTSPLKPARTADESLRSDEEYLEQPSKRRRRGQQPATESVNSMLHGQTARPSTKGKRVSRR